MPGTKTFASQARIRATRGASADYEKTCHSVCVLNQESHELGIDTALFLKKF